MIDIKFTFPDMLGALQKNMEEINLFIAANMQTNRAMLFDAEGAYNGHEKWAPLKFRRGRILQDRGTLKKSMGPTNDGSHPVRTKDGILQMQGETVTIGTTLAYAQLMNDGTKKLSGGVITPVRAKALKIPAPPGYRPKLTGTQKAEFSTAKKHFNKKKKAWLAGNLTNDDMNNEFAKIREVRKQHQDDGKFIFRKSVKIEPRDFSSWTSQDQEEMEVALANKITEILNNA